MEPLVSVVLPVRNCAPFVSAAVESILKQTYGNLELVVVDDHSDDTTISALSKHAEDPRFRVIANRGNGLVAALNTGISESRGNYIARMDADDISMPSRIEMQVHALENNPFLGLLFTDAYIVDEQNRIIGKNCNRGLTAATVRKALTFESPPIPPLLHPSVMMRTDIVRAVGGYRNYESAEDRDLWLRLCAVTELSQLNQTGLRYRVVATSVSRSNRRRQLESSVLAAVTCLVARRTRIDIYEHPDEFMAIRTQIERDVCDIYRTETIWNALVAAIRRKRLTPVCIELRRCLISGGVLCFPQVRRRALWHVCASTTSRVVSRCEQSAISWKYRIATSADGKNCLLL